jgi:hypothetical protein
MPSDENKITFSVEASDLDPEALLAPSETTSASRQTSMAATPPSLRLMENSPPLENKRRGILAPGPRSGVSVR